MSSRLTSKGQVTIPKKVREYLGIGPGDSVEFRAEDGKVTLRTAKPGRKRPAFRVSRQTAANFKAMGPTTDAIMKFLRD